MNDNQIRIPTVLIEALADFEMQLQAGYTDEMQKSAENWYMEKVVPLQSEWDKTHPSIVEPGPFGGRQQSIEFLDSLDWFFRRLRWAKCGSEVIYVRTKEDMQKVQDYLLKCQGQEICWHTLSDKELYVVISPPNPKKEKRSAG